MDGGDFYVAGGKKEKKKLLKQKREEGTLLTVVRSGILSCSAGAEERGVEDHNQCFVYMKIGMAKHIARG